VKEISAPPVGEVPASIVADAVILPRSALRVIVVKLGHETIERERKSRFGCRVRFELVLGVEAMRGKQQLPLVAPIEVLPVHLEPRRAGLR